jgi:hypothetical protein
MGPVSPRSRASCHRLAEPLGSLARLLAAAGSRRRQSGLRASHCLAAAGQRVEVACAGGVNRTGTTSACIAQLGGVASFDAVTWVREHYNSRAIETPWQRRYVRLFRPASKQN